MAELPKPNKSGNLRGKNPRSHGNNNKGGKVKRNVSISPSTEMRSRILGDSLSDGLDKSVDKLFVILPVFGKAKLAIELLLSGDPKAKEYAEAALLDMEDLEIEHLCKEAITEGIIQPKGGAWIA
jgi:hypothetical protein